MAIDASEAGHRLAVLQGDYLFETGFGPSLRNAQRIYVMLWRFQAEIYNGGIWQFFTNSTNMYAPYICDALRIVDADKISSIMEEAIANSRPGTPWYSAMKCSGLRRNAPIEVRDIEEKLNRRLALHLDDLSVLLFKYMSKHRHEFDVPEEFWEEGTLQ
ncbi:MAG: DUF4375 domain-containing protein [Afipia sp.]|nr:DUF4375 domain-containing protein [Afipia sp.]